MTRARAVVIAVQGRRGGARGGERPRHHRDGQRRDQRPAVDHRRPTGPPTVHDDDVDQDHEHRAASCRSCGTTNRTGSVRPRRGRAESTRTTTLGVRPGTVTDTGPERFESYSVAAGVGSPWPRPGSRRGTGSRRPVGSPDEPASRCSGRSRHETAPVSLEVRNERLGRPDPCQPRRTTWISDEHTEPAGRDARG